MEYKYNDGGRSEAGYKNSNSDCAVRAIAIATGKTYKEVHKELTEINKFKNQKYFSARYGNTKGITIRNYMRHLGWKWTATMKIGSGCKVHLKKEELPTGKIVCSVSKHMVAVIDGVIQDTHNCSRNGTRCVYGYFEKQ